MTRILIAERDPLVCGVLADAMEIGFGAAVTSAGTGALAAEMIARDRFDLAVISYFFPDISGFDLAERAARRDIPSLLITGHPDALAQLRNSGYPYLRKPFSLEELSTQAGNILVDTTENIRRVKASVARLRDNLIGLQSDLAESRRLLDQSRHLGTGGDRIG